MTTHAETIARYLPSEVGTCEVRTERGDYPYECVVKDERPNALVSTCLTHLVWWIEEETS